MPYRVIMKPYMAISGCLGWRYPDAVHGDNFEALVARSRGVLPPILGLGMG